MRTISHFNKRHRKRPTTFTDTGCCLQNLLTSQLGKHIIFLLTLSALAPHSCFNSSTFLSLVEHTDEQVYQWTRNYCCA